jgi:hypothetical protein
MSTTTTQTSVFESKPCSRCGGCGEYSYCYSHGTRCFKCGGRGWVHTKRGAAASEFYSSLLTVPATEVEVGTKIRIPGIPGIIGTCWLLVDSIDTDHVSSHRITKDEDGNEVREPMVSVLIKGRKRVMGSDWSEDNLEEYGYGLPATDKVRVARSSDEKKAARDEALAFQATLTQKGEPRK